MKHLTNIPVVPLVVAASIIAGLLVRALVQLTVQHIVQCCKCSAKIQARIREHHRAGACQTHIGHGHHEAPEKRYTDRHG